jgi:DNA-binding MarR family transcriptional regulator
MGRVQFVTKTAGRTDDDAALRSAWSKLVPMFLSKREGFIRLIASHDLTPPHGMALTMLLDGPMRMRDIADRMVCDASYVTAIVDRLEQAGLAARQASSTDRRVKEIALTPAGIRAATAIKDEMSAPPAALRQLSSTDRATLARILGKLEQPALERHHPRTAFHVHDR